MKINNALLKDVVGITLDFELDAAQLGLVNTQEKKSISFIDTSKYIPLLISNNNIETVFTTSEIAQMLPSRLKLIVCDDPRYIYFTLLSYIGKKLYVKFNSIIDSSSIIHETAFISPNNVKIGRNCIIEPKAIIMADVEIGDNCIIRAGAVLGSEGFEHKRTSKGILSVYHDGNVFIDNSVEVGSNSCVDKGYKYRQTIIQSGTKIDNLVHIAHGVQIGKNCFIIASSMIAGSCTIKNNVWIGPNASIAPQIIIDDNAFITLGSVVTKNVGKGEWVSGNFAIPHKKFLENLKKSI